MEGFGQTDKCGGEGLMTGPPPLKDDSYQSKLLKRLWDLMLPYENDASIKIFEKFKGVYYNARKSLPDQRFPAVFLYVDSIGRDPFAIKRTDWWMVRATVVFYTKDHNENSMDQHYLWVEGLDRVCRVNPRLGGISGVHKTDLDDVDYTFGYGKVYVMSETKCTVNIRTKLCLAKKLS